MDKKSVRTMTRAFGLMVVALAMTRRAVAADRAADAPHSLVEAAAGILDELQATKAFVQGHRSDVLVAECAVLRYGHRPTEALAAARAIREPFCASLALGGIAAQQLDNDPSQANALFLEAQERALKIDRWSGPDATSLPYLFELIPLFKPTVAKTMVDASRENLRRWEADEYRKSHAMAALSRAMIAVNPSGVDGLLREASTSAQSNHYFKSIRLLGLFAVRMRKEWAGKEAERFYAAGRDWPPPWETIDEYFPLVVVLQGDALADLPKALNRIERLPEEQQDRAHLDLAIALHEAGRTDEAILLLDKVVARTKANATQIRWVRDASRGLRAQWTAKKVHAVPPEEIDRFLDQPEPSALEAMRDHVRPVVLFRNDEQAAAFAERALPLAQGMKERGYPHHGSPRSVLLGALAQIAAMQGDWDKTKKIADGIVIPELQAFYLMEAYAASRPLPDALREWPIYFYTRTEVRIGN